jgi:hypothetical protein
MFYKSSMLIHGSPLVVTLPADLSLQDRFWYWQGASGRKYIHSIYEPEHCPPLPGAIYIGVRRQGTMRIAVALGRFLPFWDGTLAFDDLNRLIAEGVDEIHVHLLAKSPEVAEAVLADLREAMSDQPGGFSEMPSPALRAA